MSKFFDSEVVRESVFELEALQTQLSTDLLNLANYSYEQRKEHLETLKTFLEKQKIFFFRVSLSDDPDALLIKEKVIETAKMFGYDEIDGMEKFFETLDHTIEKLQKSLDRQQVILYNKPVVIQRILIHPNQSYVFSKS